MANYIPPHKRLSKSQEGPSLTMVPQIKNKMNDKRGYRHLKILGKNIYADKFISRCLVVPLTDDGQVPSSVHLAPISLESVEWKAGHEPLTLVDEHSKREHTEVTDCCPDSPWISVVEKIHSDLILAYHNVRNEMENEALEKIKPDIVARFGKVLFRRSSSLNQESLKELLISESALSDLKKSFYTSIPVSYMEHIRSDVVSKIGVNFDEEKELYHVKLADALRPESTISCKCRVSEGEKKLEMYKMELNPVRHLVVDISCVNSNVDLRLALCTKKIITVLTDEEKQVIKDLIDSAIIDQNLKGGLKWPLGKANSGSRFSVVGVWHTKTESYSNPCLRITMREADRYNFLASTGEVAREVTLKLNGITRCLLEMGGEVVSISTLLEDTLKLIWDSFLSWEGSLVSYC